MEEHVKANEYLGSWEGHWSTQHYLTLGVWHSLVPYNNLKLQVIKLSKQMWVKVKIKYEEIFPKILFSPNVESRKFHFINKMRLQDTEHILFNDDL